MYDGKTGDPIGGPLGSFYAYDPSFTGGVYATSGDVDGDGVADLITAAGAGGSPHVKVFSGNTGQLIASFYAFDTAFRGGATVAAADFTGDGKADLVVGAGPGGGPNVRVFDLSTGQPLMPPLGSFYAFDPSFTGGVDVGTDWKTGDVNGDSVPDIVVGRGPGAGSLVRVFDGKSGQVIREFSPFGADMTAGVRVGTSFVDDDEFADVVTVTGAGVPARVKVFSGATGDELAPPMSPYLPFGEAFTGGLYVAASNDPPLGPPPPPSPPAGGGDPPAGTGSLTGKVFDDLDGDWGQQVTDPLVAGATVALLNLGGAPAANASGQLVPVVTTGADGAYLFTNLVPGAYTARVTAPVGYRMEANRLPEWSQTTTVQAGGLIDFATPAYRPTTISGTAWVDLDQNQLRDPGEPDATGVVVALLDGERSVVATATTGATGAYSLTAVPTGSFVLRFTPPAGYALSTPAGGDTFLAVRSGESQDGRNVGVRLPGGSVAGHMWLGASPNGVADVAVALTDAAGTPVGSSVTAADGSFSIPDLSSGTYTVAYSAPEGYQQSGTGLSTWSGTLTVTSGQTTDASAVVSGYGSLSGFVWDDRDGGDAGSSEDPYRAGVIVAVRDGNGQAVLDADGQPVPDMTTNASGGYTFARLSPGSYAVTFTAPTGFRMEGSRQSAFSTTKVVTAATTASLDAAAYQPGTISGTVWQDQTTNGTRDAGEPGTAGALVTLSDADGQLVATATTGAAGGYSFAALLPGSYTLKVTPPAGSVVDDSSNAWTNTLTLAPGGSSVVEAPTYVPGAATGRLFVDANGDGTRQAGEAGRAGVPVSLFDEDGSPAVDAAGATVPTVTTDAAGQYAFSNLLLRSYSVRFAAPTGTLYTTAYGWEQYVSLSGSGGSAATGLDAGVSATTSTIPPNGSLDLAFGDVATDSPVQFRLDSTATPAPTFGTVEWDFQYDGVTFHPAQNASGGAIAKTFTTTGTRTVAARVTDSAGNVRILSESVTVADAPPTLTVPTNATAVAGVAATLSVQASARSGIQSVQWWVSTDGDDYELISGLTTTSGLHTFDTYGTYSVWVEVTANDGQVTDDSFDVEVAESIPQLAVQVAGPINEGQQAEFTVNLTDTDLWDNLTLYADWKGTGEFDEVSVDDYTYDPDDRTIQFRHTFDEQPKTYAVGIRVEDDGGQKRGATVSVVVNAVKPTATLETSRPASTSAQANVDLWVVDEGDAIQLADAEFATEWEEDGAQYHFVIQRAGQAPMAEVVLATPDYAFDEYIPGTVYVIEAWVEDTAHVVSDHHKMTVMIGGGFSWGNPENGADAATISGNTRTAGGYVSTPEVTWRDLHALGTVRLLQDAPLRIDASYGSSTMYVHKDYPANTAFTVHPELNPITVQLAAREGYSTIVYRYNWSVYDTTPTFWGNPQSVLISQAMTVNGGDLQFVSGYPANRAVQVLTDVGFTNGGTVVWTPLIHVSFGSVTVSTPVEKTWVQELGDWLGTIQNLASQFADIATDLITAIGGPAHWGQFALNVVNGLAEGLGGFVKELASENFVGRLIGWLIDPSGPVPAGGSLASTLLNMVGLSWDHLFGIIRDELGEGNLAALEQIFGGAENSQALNWFAGLSPTDPAVIQKLFDRVKEMGYDLPSLKDLIDEVEKKIVAEAKKGFEKAMVQLVARLNPVVGGISAVFKTVTWLHDNQAALGDLVQAFKESIQSLGGDSHHAFAEKVKGILNQAMPLLLSYAVTQLGLKGTVDAIKTSVQQVRFRVDDAVRKAVRAVASKVPKVGTPAVTLQERVTIRTASVAGGTASPDVYDGMIGTAREFRYGGRVYRLFAAQDGSKTTAAGVSPVRRKVSVKVAEHTAQGDKLVAVLVSRNFDDRKDANSATDLDGLVNAARGLVTTVRRGNGGTAQTLTPAAVAAQTAALRAAEDAVVRHIFQDACRVLTAGCFAAGTRLWTPDGFRAIEDIRPGERVYSRDEWDAVGAVSAKIVEEVFTRYAGVYDLRAGGRVIRTTGEHPFFVAGKGWSPAHELRAGDRVLCADGTTVAVEGVTETGDWELVYNLRVSEYHTYTFEDLSALFIAFLLIVAQAGRWESRRFCTHGP